MENEIKLHLKGMKCNSCEQIIERIAQKQNVHVKEINANAGYAKFECEPDKVNELKKVLTEKGFPEKQATADRGSLRGIIEYISFILAGNPKTKAETQLANYTLMAFIALTVIGLIAYSFALKPIMGVQRIPLVFLSMLVSIALTVSYYGIKHYRSEITCSLGMMVGMTVGMISGLWIGAIIGATNGMFWGSLTGMVFGIIIGVQLGRCCGIMGALEGLMAGIMSGIMGAMTSIMMLRENMVLFLYILFATGVIVLIGLNYMLYRETETGTIPVKIKFTRVILVSALLWAIQVLIIVLMPQGIVVYG